jgi:hypothetical protein
MNRITLACLAPLMGLMLSGCDRPVLEGPNHPVGEPPWVAPDHEDPTGAMEIHHRLLLIGDAGLYLENDPTLAALGVWAEDVAESTVVFLGDNIYDDGLTEEEREQAEQILSQQLASTSRRRIVLPGNHDWGMKPAERNIRAILNQQAFIDGWDGNVEFIPRDGCIGPTATRLGSPGEADSQIVLIALDPTPFLSPRLRDLCPDDPSNEEHFGQLARLLETHSNDQVIVASHYPMLTGGPHGGLSYGFIGDLLVRFYAWSLGTLADTHEPRYAKWISRTREVFRLNPPLVYAAGHDHSLQVLQPGPEVGVEIVSGAGAPKRVSTVTHLPQTRFAHAAPGFIVVDFGSHEGTRIVRLRVIENGHADAVFEMDL